MNRIHKFGVVSAAALALLVSTSVAQSQVVLPKVTSINGATDVVQIIPNAQTAPTNLYATVGQLLGASSTSTTGIPAFSFPLLTFKNSDGTTLAATAASGKFGLAITAGTSEDLISEAANSNTKTDVASNEVTIPASYATGANITLTCNTQYTLGSGTVGTHTLAAAAYLVANAGTQGATLIATAAQTIPAAAGEVNFTITGSTLSPGSRLFLTYTVVIQDTGGSNITAQVNSCRLS